jgi:hypothetical protein
MTYRDDLQAARMRREALARELREVRSRMDEFDGLARQADALGRELAQCARDLDQARAKAELPLLQRVRVASPCHERWDDMTGDERVRFCGRCEKNVHDLSALSASQAEALLRERGGESMCVSFFRRSDGTILTSDCPVGGRKRFWRRAATAAVASGLVAAGITMAAAVEGQVVQGKPAIAARMEGRSGFGMVPMNTARRGVEAEEVRAIEARIEDAQARAAAGRFGGFVSIAPSDVQIQALNAWIADAQARLAAANTAEDVRAIGWELEGLRAEITSRQRR